MRCREAEVSEGLLRFARGEAMVAGSGGDVGDFRGGKGTRRRQSNALHRGRLYLGCEE